MAGTPASLPSSRAEPESLCGAGRRSGTAAVSLHRRLKLLGLIGGGEKMHFATVQVQHAQRGGSVQRLHFPNGLMLEFDGRADLALVEQLLRLSQAVR